MSVTVILSVENEVARMAYKFKCINCGDISYSAAPLELQKFPLCEKCGGTVLRVQPPMKLGEILIALGIMSEQDLKRALEVQEKMTEHLVIGRLLIKLNLIGRNELERALQIQRDMLSGTQVQ
uniref:Uncharacterized protein n=1 Tax=Pseudothermotoga hypogea TaxID=57487 RepID=A0A832I8M5_9THEM